MKIQLEPTIGGEDVIIDLETEVRFFPGERQTRWSPGTADELEIDPELRTVEGCSREAALAWMKSDEGEAEIEAAVMREIVLAREDAWDNN